MLSRCCALLLPLLIGPAIAAESQLQLRPSQERFASGDRIWWLEWRQGKRLMQRWAAASGASQSQGLDRRWSPGNGAPLPVGTYMPLGGQSHGDVISGLGCSRASQPAAVGWASTTVFQGWVASACRNALSWMRWLH
jgi:hypothetical protein